MLLGLGVGKRGPTLTDGTETGFVGNGEGAGVVSFVAAIRRSIYNGLVFLSALIIEMAGLPNNTFTAPGVPFYATAGGGAATSLQSPVAVIPAVGGSINVNAITTGGNSSLRVLGGIAGGITVGSGVTGRTAQYLLTGIYGAPTVGNDTFSIIKQGAIAPMIYNVAPDTLGTAPDNLYLGTGSGGVVKTNDSLLVQSPLGAGVNGVAITTNSGSAGTIFQTVPTGGSLTLGSSLAAPATMILVDNGPGLGYVNVGGNGGADIIIAGGAVPDIRTNSINNGTLVLGASAANPNLLYIRDNLTAGTGVIDVFSGAVGSSSLRLFGGTSTTHPKLTTNSNNGTGGFLDITCNFDDATPDITLADNGPGNANSIELNSATSLHTSLTATGTFVPILLKAAGSSVGVFDVDCTPLPNGFSLVYGGATTPNNNDRLAMFSVWIFKSVGNIVGGGVGGVPGSVTVQPSLTSATALNVNIAAATSVNYTINGFPMMRV